jgi:hypothetical protein
MMKKMIVPISMLCIAMLGSVGRSAIVLSVDMDLVTPGIQSNIEASPGATVTAGLMIELTAPTSLAVYNFSVEFDRNELTFQSRSETPDALTGLSELDATNGNNISTGQLFRFDGGTFAATGGPTGPFGPVRVGQVAFLVSTPTGSATDIDVRPGRFEPLFDTFFDNLGSEVTAQVTFVGGSVTAIPEPTSLGLVAIGCTIMSLGWRRRS